MGKRREINKINQAVSEAGDAATAVGTSEFRMAAIGMGGQIDVDENWVTIRRKGVLAKLGQGLKGEKRILIANITAVQLKMPGLTNGYIQFTVPGGNESKRGVFDAAKDENSVVFTSRQKDKFWIIRDHIEAVIIARSRPAPIPAPAASSSLADELKKFAELRDSGVLTANEFAQQKARLLG